MSMEREEKARSKTTKGQPLLKKRLLVRLKSGSLVGRATEEETACQRCRLPLLRQDVAPGQALTAQPSGAASTWCQKPRPPPAARSTPLGRGQDEAASTCCKLPHLPTAPSTSSSSTSSYKTASTCCKLPPLPAATFARGRNTAISAATSGHQEVVSSARGTWGDRGTSARVEIWQPALHGPGASVPAGKGTAWHVPSEPQHKVFTGRWGCCKQPAARQHRAIPRRAEEVWAADRQRPLPDPHRRGSTGVACSTTAPASLERDAGPACCGQMARRVSERFTVRVRCQPHSSLSADHGAAADRLTIQTVHTEHLEDQERSCPAQTCAATRQRQQGGLEARLLWRQESEEQEVLRTESWRLSVRSRRTCRVSLKVCQPEARRCRELLHDATSREDMLEWMEAPGPSQQQVGARRKTFLPVLDNKAGDLVQEGEEDSDGDDIIWPYSQEFFQDLSFVPQEESSSSSSMGTEAEEQEDNYQHSTYESLEFTEAEPAASAWARALGKEGHHLPLSPVPQEEAKAPACLAFSELDTAVEAESLAPVSSSPREDDVALADTDHFIVGDAVDKAVLVTEGPEQQDTTAEAEGRAPLPSSPTDDDLAQGDTDHFMVRESVAKAVVMLEGPDQEDTRGEAECLAPVPSSPTDGDLAQVDTDHFIVRESVAKAVVMSEGPDKEDTRGEAECLAPVPSSPTDGDLAPVDTHHFVVRESVAKAVLTTEGQGQQDTTAEAEGLAPVPSCPRDDDLAPVDTHELMVREFVARAVLVMQGSGYLSKVQQDLLEDMGQQAEPSTAFGSWVAQEAEGTSSPLADTDTPKAEPGTATPPEATARRKRSSLFRRVSRGVRRLFQFYRRAHRRQEPSSPASTGRVPGGGHQP